MNRDEKLIIARNHYIIEIVNSSNSVTQAVFELSQRLYLSERSIYRIIKTTDMDIRSNKNLQSGCK